MTPTQNIEELLKDPNIPESLSFYDGRVTLLFDPSIHAYYRVDGDQKFMVAGATSVTAMVDKSAPLMYWAVNQALASIRADAVGKEVITVFELEPILEKARLAHRRIKEDARDVGHDAHSWLEHFIKCYVAGIPTYIPKPSEPRALNCVESALRFFTLHNFEPINAEERVYSLEYDCAGTYDWLGKLTACGDPQCCPFEGTHIELGDFKSSNSLHDEYRMQTAFYVQALTEEHPEIQVAGRRLLRLGKEEGDFESWYLPAEEQELDFDGFAGALRTFTWKKKLDLDRKWEKEKARALNKAKKEAAKKPRAPKKVVMKHLTTPINVEVGSASQVTRIPVEV